MKGPWMVKLGWFSDTPKGLERAQSKLGFLAFCRKEENPNLSVIKKWPLYGFFVLDVYGTPKGLN